MRGLDFEVAPGEVFGLLGPNGAGKTTTVEILEGYRDAHGRDRLGARPRSRSSARGRCASGSASSCSRPGCTATSPRARRCAHFAALLSAPARRRRGHRDHRPAGEGRRLRAHAVGRPAAPARPRARAHRRPRADLPRRADDRLRPGGAPQRVGGHPLAAGAGQDDPAHHALPRRGPGAVRPRGDRQGGADPRRRAARASSARRRRATAWPGATRTASCRRARSRTRPRCCTSSRAPRWPAARRCTTSRSRGPSLEDVYLELTAEAPRRRAVAEAAALAYRQWRLERRMFWRNPTAAFFSFVLPLLFLVPLRRDLLRRPEDPRRHRPGHRSA